MSINKLVLEITVGSGRVRETFRVLVSKPRYWFRITSGFGPNYQETFGGMKYCPCGHNTNNRHGNIQCVPLLSFSGPRNQSRIIFSDFWPQYSQESRLSDYQILYSHPICSTKEKPTFSIFTFIPRPFLPTRTHHEKGTKKRRRREEKTSFIDIMKCRK